MGSCTSSTSGEGGEGEVETDTADTTVQQDAAQIRLYNSEGIRSNKSYVYRRGE